MAKAEIVTEFRGDPADLMRALSRSERAVKNLKTQLRETGKVGRKAGRASSAAFATGQLRRYVGMLTGGGGVLLALRTITRELERHRDIQSQAAATGTTVSGARQDLLFNLNMLPEAMRVQALGNVASISREFGISQTFMAKGMAGTVSATGAEPYVPGRRRAPEALDLPLATQVLRFIAPLLVHNPSALELFGGATVGMGKVTGSRDPAYNLGMLNKVLGMSRITDPKQAARTIPTGMIGQVGYGNTPAEAGALVAALATYSEDVMGERTGTAAINFMKIMDETMPRRRMAAMMKIDPSEVTLRTRLAFLRAHPRYAERMIRTLPEIRAKALAPIRALLSDPESPMAEAFEINVKELEGRGPSGIGLREAGMSIAPGMHLDPAKATADLGRMLKTGTETLQLINKTGARGGILRTEILEQLKATRTGYVRAWFDKWQYELRTGFGTRDALPVGIDLLETRAAELEPHTTTQLQYSRTGRLLDPLETTFTPTAEQADMATELRRISAFLKEGLDKLGALAGEKRTLTPPEEKPERN